MFTLSTQVGAKYLLIVVTGSGGVGEMCALNAFVGELTARTGVRRILLDSIAFEALLADGDAQAVVAHMAAAIPALDKVAVLVQAGGGRGLVMATALARGFHAAEFDNLPAAEEWLLA